MYIFYLLDNRLQNIDSIEKEQYEFSFINF